MTRIIRVLAVIALALSPVWGVQTVVAASSPAPSHYPTFPSYASNGCATAGNGYITCGGNGIILTQVNSGYACSTIMVSFDGVVLQQQPLVVTVTANSGSFNSNFSVSGDGDYSVNIPGFLVNNLAVIQITASTGGSFFLSNVGVSTCAVPSSTATVNPSDTATNTPAPITGTPTSIPTFTPIPVTHNTFTPTVTRTGTPVPATPTVTSTPGIVYRDCGEPSYPLLNCDFIGGSFFSVPPTDWLPWSAGGFVMGCWDDTVHPDNANLFTNFNGGGGYYGVCQQSVTAEATGDLFLEYQANPANQISFGATIGAYNETSPQFSTTTCTVGSSNYCTMDIGAVTDGDNTTFLITKGLGGSGEIYEHVFINKAWISSTSATSTPTSTGTPTATSTPAPATSTPVLSYTNTPVPIPGAPETAIPTNTECPGSCVVTALTAIPGMATRTTVDTSPFSALTHLSMARSSCAPFGYVQIPYPVITGTPALGQPLNFGWTVPVTHTWDNTNPLSNTAIQPCAMSEIPSSLWDFTYWFSVFGIATVFIMWLIGLVGRLSGEETING